MPPPWPLGWLEALPTPADVAGELAAAAPVPEDGAELVGEPAEDGAVFAWDSAVLAEEFAALPEGVPELDELSADPVATSLVPEPAELELSLDGVCPLTPPPPLDPAACEAVAPACASAPLPAAVPADSPPALEPEAPPALTEA